MRQGFTAMATLCSGLDREYALSPSQETSTDAPIGLSTKECIAFSSLGDVNAIFIETVSFCGKCNIKHSLAA